MKKDKNLSVPQRRGHFHFVSQRMKQAESEKEAKDGRCRGKSGGEREEEDYFWKYEGRRSRRESSDQHTVGWSQQVNVEGLVLQGKRWPLACSLRRC